MIRSAVPRPGALQCKEAFMLGDIVELTVVVRDLDAAVERFTGLFGLKVHHRAESKEFGFKTRSCRPYRPHRAPQPTDPERPWAAFSPSTAKASTSWASSARTSR